MGTKGIDNAIVKDSWWPVISYFPLTILLAVLLMIPILILFPDSFDTRGGFDQHWHEQFSLQIATQTVFLLAAFAASYVVASADNRLLREHGFSINIKELFIGLATGAVSIMAFAMAGQLFGFIQFHFDSISIVLLESLLMFFLVAVAEETFIRGYLLFKLKRKVGKYGALAITSLLFGVMHIANDHVTWIGIANISLSGLLMGMMVLHTNSLSPAIGMHWAWNFVQGSIFGFGVSGHQEQGVFSAVSTTKDLFSGGAFGAEGSIILIPITLLAIVCIHRFYKHSEL